MKLPNLERAVVEPEKLTDYLLNINHRRGGSKARLLIQCGYRPENWQQLEADLRQYHLSTEASIVRSTPYGTRYEIVAEIQTPSGRMLNLRSVWQIDTGQDFPRLITLFPD